jgi:hypothetical protein
VSTRISVLNILKLRQVRLEHLRERMSQESFEPEGNSGFLIERSNDREVVGRYVEKYSTREAIRDPFGAEYFFDRVHFAEQRFEIRLQSPNVVLFDASSVLKRLIGRLSEYSDFQIVIAPVECSPTRLADELLKSLEQPEVYAIAVAESNVTPDLSVKMTFEGLKDIQKDVRKFLTGKRPEYSALKIKFIFADTLRRCEIRKNGAVNIFGEYDPELVPLFVRAIKECSVEAT